VASIPPPDDPIRLSDKEILREFPRPEPLDPKVIAEFALLAELLTAHLDETVRLTKRKSLARQLKPGTTPSEALCDWLNANAGKRQRQIGVIGLDWKAREEIEWQAELLAKAHQVPLSWQYDVEGDTDWKNWQTRQESPVSSPIRSLSNRLAEEKIALFQVDFDDQVFVFAVGKESAEKVRDICLSLSIAVICLTP
jgi:hypothetical protein